MRAAKFDATVYADTTHARARLAALADRATDLRPAMRVVRDLMIKGHKEAWASEGSVFGQSWPANAPGTLARKARMGQPQRPLQASGALEQAIRGGKGRYSRVMKTSVRVGVRLHYARYQMGKGRLPARPMVGMTKKTERAAMLTLEKFLTR